MDDVMNKTLERFLNRSPEMCSLDNKCPSTDDDSASFQHIDNTLARSSQQNNELLGLVKDISTLNSQIRSKLSDNEKQELSFHTILHTTPHGVIITDEDDTIVSLNSTVTKMFGYTTNELLGHNIHILFKVGVVIHPEFSETAIRVTGLRHNNTECEIEATNGMNVTIDGIHSYLKYYLLRDMSSVKARQNELLSKEQSAKALNGIMMSLLDTTIFDKFDDVLKDVCSVVNAKGAVVYRFIEDTNNAHIMNIVPAAASAYMNILDNVIAYIKIGTPYVRELMLNKPSFILSTNEIRNMPSNVLHIGNVDITHVIGFPTFDCNQKINGVSLFLFNAAPDYTLEMEEKFLVEFSKILYVVLARDEQNNIISERNAAIGVTYEILSALNSATNIVTLMEKILLASHTASVSIYDTHNEEFRHHVVTSDIDKIPLAKIVNTMNSQNWNTNLLSYDTPYKILKYNSQKTQLKAYMDEVRLKTLLLVSLGVNGNILVIGWREDVVFAEHDFTMFKIYTKSIQKLLKK